MKALLTSAMASNMAMRYMVVLYRFGVGSTVPAGRDIHQAGDGHGLGLYQRRQLVQAGAERLGKYGRVDLRNQVIDRPGHGVFPQRGNRQRTQHAGGAPGSQQAAVDAADVFGAENVRQVRRDGGENRRRNMVKMIMVAA